MTWSISASAETYNSPFGFSVDLPPNWDHFFNNEGEIEYYYPVREAHRSTDIALGTFLPDEIHVVKIHTKDFSDTLEGCSESTILGLSKYLPKPMKVYACGYRKMGSLYGVFREHEGLLGEGVRAMDFSFFISRNEIIRIIGTCKNGTLKVFRKEYEGFINSLKIR
jgi:hypothetical protein